ncbi:ABC transporter permease [Kribbella sp. NPDC049227]|uniref:ABC transporter permease n=1 Tax=Kribbella sp. NPDC049227 TaxID=3364113 RepID=UPI00372441E4
MLSYVGRRMLLGLFTIWAVSVLSFAIIQLPPGDFATTYLARLADSGAAASAEAEQIRAQFGLDQPIYVQYLKWLGSLLHGDLGVSLDYNRPVADVIGDRLPTTVVVSLVAIAFTWMLALPIGVYSAVRKYSLGDYALTFLGFLGLAIPNFLFALIVMYFGFAVLDANVGGLYSAEFETAPWSIAKAADLLQHLWVPAIVLGLAGTAQLVRVMRANLLDELKKPYVVTARAKGLSERRLIAKYPVRVALNPFASSIGFLFPQIVSGAVVVSIVLSLPTVGPLLLAALQAQDMFLAGAIVLMLGVLTVIGTLISDLVLMWLDPRIRHAR